MVESRLDIICPSFFPAAFTEKEPSTHADMWDALLLMTKSNVFTIKNIYPSILPTHLH
jgi:hypothetical protein